MASNIFSKKSVMSWIAFVRGQLSQCWCVTTTTSVGRNGLLITAWARNDKVDGRKLNGQWQTEHLFESSLEKLHQVRAAKWRVGLKSRAAGGGGGGSRWDEVFWTTNHMHLRVRAILIQCASKQLKKPNFTSGSLCEFVTLWPICSSPAETRAWELLPLINTEHGASCLRCAF